MKNKGSAVVWIIIVIAIIIIAGGIYLYSQSKQSAVAPAQNQAATSTEVTSTTMAGWQTYASQGFSLQYPANTKIISMTDGEGIFFNIDPSSSYDSLQIIVSNQGHSNPYTQDPSAPQMSSVTIDGTVFNRQDFSAGYSGMHSPANVISYSTVRGNMVYQIVEKTHIPSENSLLDQVTDQMLSTFKFINQ